ncbi:haloacid dehalogenase type II [Croceibacter atlanticus]|uniref:haloacid dehalogenase type II n=1 Tax=Croceibacter atlanticus TaxID=313588 RepID=UPI002E0FC467|nr:haloacid dehalogenase type II [Croceibacter atlanticus]
MMKNTPKLLIFDVNETLLDLSLMERAMNNAFGNEAAFQIWFHKLLMYSFAETIQETYNDFGAIGKAVLKMVEAHFNVHISEAETKTILNHILNLKPHADVVEALQALKTKGFILVALTNGSKDALEQQIENAELSSYFNALFSVSAVKVYKPHANTYKYVLDSLNVSAEQAILVAAHGWDIIGAQQAGLQTAFIEREKKSIYPLGKKPTLSCRSLKELVKQLS